MKPFRISKKYFLKCSVILSLITRKQISTKKHLSNYYRKEYYIRICKTSILCYSGQQRRLRKHEQRISPSDKLDIFLCQSRIHLSGYHLLKWKSDPENFEVFSLHFKFFILIIIVDSSWKLRLQNRSQKQTATFRTTIRKIGWIALILFIDCTGLISCELISDLTSPKNNVINIGYYLLIEQYCHCNNTTSLLPKAAKKIGFYSCAADPPYPHGPWSNPEILKYLVKSAIF